MRLITLSILLVLGVLSLVGAGLPVLAAEVIPSADGPDLETAYGAWVEALEGRLNNHSSWEFPFAAPDPAELAGRDLETVLALRRFSRNHSLVELETLVDRVARRTEPLPVQMKFWMAYGLNLLHRNQASLTQLVELLEGPEYWRYLENGQVVWVLTGTGDNLFLLERRNEAAALYRRLADSGVEQLNLWGNYQLAGFEFLAREFEESDRRYRLVCDSERAGAWRDHACEMAAIAGQLATLRTEGMGHGIAADVAP